jgi:hypothetical protein
MPTHEQFVRIVKDLWIENRSSLEASAAASRAVRNDPNWMWKVLVQSFCTIGGSANLDRKLEKYGSMLSWTSVSAMTDEARSALFYDLPNPVRRHIATPGLEHAFVRIRDAGGPAALTAEYERLETAKERMGFLRSFRGIGAKYSRNIPMDVYDEKVLDYFALDSRLNKILDHLTPNLPRSYRIRENYLRRVAEEAGVPNAWFLDRLLYSHHSTVVIRLVSAP